MVLAGGERVPPGEADVAVRWEEKRRLAAAIAGVDLPVGVIGGIREILPKSQHAPGAGAHSEVDRPQRPHRQTSTHQPGQSRRSRNTQAKAPPGAAQGQPLRKDTGAVRSPERCDRRRRAWPERRPPLASSNETVSCGRSRRLNPTPPPSLSLPP